MSRFVLRRFLLPFAASLGLLLTPYPAFAQHGDLNPWLGPRQHRLSPERPDAAARSCAEQSGSGGPAATLNLCGSSGGPRFVPRACFTNRVLEAAGAEFLPITSWCGGFGVRTAQRSCQHVVAPGEGCEVPAFGAGLLWSIGGVKSAPPTSVGFTGDTSSPNGSCEDTRTSPRAYLRQPVPYQQFRFFVKLVCA